VDDEVVVQAEKQRLTKIKMYFMLNNLFCKFYVILFILGRVVIFFLSLAPALHAEDILVTAPRELENFSAATNTSVLPVKSTDRTLADIFNQSSGIYLSQSYGLKEDTLSIRGFSNAQLKILIDGVPLEQSGFSLNEIPTDIVDKIIVSRGPMSSLYGNSAMGGVVNILTKKNYESSKVAASYGSFASWDLKGQTAYSVDAYRYYLVSYYNRTNGRYRIRTDTSLYDPGSKDTFHIIENNAQENFGGKLGFQLQKLHTSLTLNQKDRGIPGLIEHPTPHIHERYRDYRFVLNFDDYKPMENLSSDLMLFESGQFTNYKDPQGEQNGFASEYASRIHSRGAAFKIKYISFENLIPSLRFDFLRDDFADSYIQKSRDTYTVSSNVDIYWGNFIFAPSLSRTFASQLPQEQSYGLGTVYMFNAEFSLKSQVGTSFRYPKFEELYLARGFMVGNPDLKPETSYGGDLGFAWTLTKFQGELSYFEYRTQNLIDYQLISGFQFKPYNFRKSKTRGLEMDVKLGKFFAFEFANAITWQEVRDNDKTSAFYGNYIPMKPWLYGRSSINYDLSRHFQLHYVFAFAKSRFVNRSNTLKLADNYSTDLGLSATLDSYLARFDVRNLFDRNNVDVRGLPLPGRSYFLTLEKTFL